MEKSVAGAGQSNSGCYVKWETIVKIAIQHAASTSVVMSIMNTTRPSSGHFDDTGMCCCSWCKAYFPCRAIEIFNIWWSSFFFDGNRRVHPQVAVPTLAQTSCHRPLSTGNMFLLYVWTWRTMVICQTLTTRVMKTIVTTWMTMSTPPIQRGGWKISLQSCPRAAFRGARRCRSWIS